MASPTGKTPELADEAGIYKEHNVTHVTEDNEARCWGCGLLLLLQSNAPIFKCGWCGALTNQKVRKDDNKWFRWRRFRDRCFVSILVVFMLFIICGGVWAMYPIIFSISYFCGVFHSTITVILAVTTFCSFSIAAFRIAGPPPNIIWGIYPNVGKGELENYTFCHSCSKPKSPRTHHCRSCGMCTLDMDHHCPFIGNCVGAANHLPFVLFLISAVISTMYVSIMSAYAGLHIWPDLPFDEGFAKLNGIGTNMALRLVKDVVVAMLRSSTLLSMRGLLLVYLFVSSVSVQIGLGVLLWQQLSFIYEGKTYLSNLSSETRDGVRDCQNISRFFGCSWLPYLVVRCFPNFRKKLK